MAVAYQENVDSQVLNNNQKRNLLEDSAFLSAYGKTVVPLGVTEKGETIIRDLSSIPHILVCGFTGTGKTAFVKTLLSVILSKHAPQDIQIVIYDTNGIDYRPFANMPHLKFPIVSERSRTISIMMHLAQEAQKRFELLANSGCSDYAKYNNLHSGDSQKIPEIFWVLDDIAALELDKNATNIFLTILRNGRIAGIHAIVVSSMTSSKALQKELISAIPCKICFRLSAKTESKAIIEQPGAEELFVPGEMIYKFQNDCYKCQCAYAADENIVKVMKNICRETASVSLLGIEASKFFADISPAGGNALYYSKVYDQLITEAAEVVIRSQNGSISILQRKLNIEFTRAAHIMDQLQELGVVSSQEGILPRIILMTIDDWNKKCTDNGLSKINVPINEDNSDFNEIVNSPETDPLESSEEIQQHFSDSNPNNEDDQDVVLRNFSEITIGDSTLSIYNNEVHITKRIITPLGNGTTKMLFGGKYIRKLFCKQPSLFSPGYISFAFGPKIEIINNRTDLLSVDRADLSNIVKIEFDSSQKKSIKSFLRQLSEDINLKIEYL